MHSGKKRFRTAGSRGSGWIWGVGRAGELGGCDRDRRSQLQWTGIGDPSYKRIVPALPGF